MIFSIKRKKHLTNPRSFNDFLKIQLRIEANFFNLIKSASWGALLWSPGPPGSGLCLDSPGAGWGSWVGTGHPRVSLQNLVLSLWGLLKALHFGALGNTGWWPHLGGDELVSWHLVGLVPGLLCKVLHYFESPDMSESRVSVSKSLLSPSAGAMVSLPGRRRPPQQSSTGPWPPPAPKHSIWAAHVGVRMCGEGLAHLLGFLEARGASAQADAVGPLGLMPLCTRAGRGGTD